MSNTHPTPDGQPPYGPQGQPNYGPQGQAPYGPQGQAPYGPQGQASYGPQGQAPYGWSGQPLTAEQAAAQTRAAKAAAKAQRPWFKKKRFALPIGAVALMTLVSVAGGGSESTATPQPGVTAAAPADASDETTTETATDTAKADRAESDKAAKEKAAAEKKVAADKAAEQKAAEEKAAADVATIGTGVTSGDFKVTITRVRDGGKKIGSAYLNEKAQGHFVLVDVKAKNNGDRASYFSSSDLELVDRDGREFSVNEMASIYVSDSNPLLEEINPGNTSKGTFAFDLPKGVDAEQAQITAGGLFDGPVTVDLS